MRSIRLAIAVVITAACAAGLSGCLVTPIDAPDTPTLTAAPRTPTSTPSPKPRTTPTPAPTQVSGATDCGGQAVTINASSRQLSVTGTCPLVEIDGNDLDVALAGATVDRVVIRGDRVKIAAADLGSVQIGGQDDQVDAASLGALEIRGDRNRVGVDRGLGAVTIGGNANDVLAGSIGAVTVQGQGNQVRSR